MSAAVLTHVHAARGANSPLAQSGLTPGGAATPADTASFLDALDQALGSRQVNPASNLAIQLPGNQNNGQNLPLSSNQAQNPANSSDPMQMLMAQLMAQGLLNQNAQNSNQVSPLNSLNQTSPLISQNQVSPLNSLNQAQALQNMVLGKSLGGSQQANALQQFDPNQASMMSIALAKALRSSGKDLNSDTQNQAALLLASLQQASLTNQASQDSGQTLSQIASSIQSLAQKNGISLPADLQQRLSDLASQGNTGSIKLLGIQASPTSSDANRLNALDLAKSNSAQNLADAKAPKTLSATIDRLQKGKTLENAFGSNGNLAAPSKNPLTQVDVSGDTHAAGQKGVSESSKALDEGSQSLVSDLKSSKESPSAADLVAANPLVSGLARSEAQVHSNSQTVALKASELSLASGLLHTEVMNAAKSGGGRIMLELTPPEQGKIRIDLQINQNGQAHLIVEGASDATKARLDQGGQNLKNEFAQMGLNLSLDLRHGSGSQQAASQGFSNSRQSLYTNTNTASQSLNSAITPANPVSGDNGANSSAVHLYA